MASASTSFAAGSRIAELVPRGGDYAIFESTGDIVKFTGTLDHRKVNEIRIRQIPPWIKE